MPSALPLKIAIATYGHTAAFKNGSIPTVDIRTDFVEVTPIIAAFRRMVRDLEFDVCEMASATYMFAREAGLPVRALPVFTFRRFHHSGFVCRPDAGIRTPKDLEGKRVGVRAWSVTTGIWTRGILQNEHGVDLSKITWVVDDEEHVKSLQLPPNVVKAPEGCSLSELMAAGELHAAFTANAGLGRAGPPKAGWVSAKLPESYVELFPDAERREAEWFRSTGIYPVHSLVVIKEALLEQHPWIAKSLFDALLGAKDHYLRQLRAGENISDMDAHYRKMAALVGDPLPYGIANNRPSIEALIRYSSQQGLLRKPAAVEELFLDPGSR